jgi:mRNA interferase RelE/StbE
MYTLSAAPGSQRELVKLKTRISGQDFNRLRAVIRGLAEDPRPHGAMKLKGSEEGYRIRVGNFRVIYEVYDNINRVVISHVLRRNETTYRT